MVASISARKSAAAAASYYQHMGKDDYYAREDEAPGRWEGRAAERLSLSGPVTKEDFEAALSGRDPKTDAALLQQNGKLHAAGWDMTFSAPKSVSVLWALAPDSDRRFIEAAQRTAVRTATTYLENDAAISRRGRAGRIREPAAGLLIAAFDHHSSRDLDPQLHTHAFIFNLAPRRDGSWGAIVSRELYRAQKGAGKIYRDALAAELERNGVRLIREEDTFRVAAIPRPVELAFSKRRQAIVEAARAYGYSSPKGMEAAALRTRKSKEARPREALFEAWRAEAKALGFELKSVRDAAPQSSSGTRIPMGENAAAKAGAAMRNSAPAAGNWRGNLAAPTGVSSRAPHAKPAAKPHAAAPSPLQLLQALQRLAATMDGAARMPGVRINLRRREKTFERE